MSTLVVGTMNPVDDACLEQQGAAPPQHSHRPELAFGWTAHARQAAHDESCPGPE